MAESMAIPLSVKLQTQASILGEQCLLSRTSHIQSTRSSYHGSRHTNQLLPGKACKPVVPHLRILNRIPQKETLTKSCCLNALVNVDGAVTSNWVPVVDQVLLLASVILTHVAGVIPAEKILFDSQKSTSHVDKVPENSSSLGRAVTNDNEVNFQFAWDIVKRKLMDSLYAVEHGIDLSERVIVFEQNSTNQPLSLCAVAEGPRMRLLWASYQCLNKEVSTISINSAAKSSKDFLEIIQKCFQPLCMAWLEEELCLVAMKPDKELLSVVVNKLNGFDNIVQSIRKAGKEDLYAELIYTLKFGSPRKGGFYNSTLFTQHGVSILEDLLITLSDGIASMYLELISVDSSISNEMNNLGLSLCTLSTRALQRLRNEVALNQWFHQNMEAVASMYEDEFDLRTLESQVVEVSGNSESGNFSWWKKLSFRAAGSMSSSSLRFIVINQVSVPVKRTKELRALTGWRYYYSIFLELTDITMPFMKTLVAKVSAAISFFLVSLIGRSLGLIYSGIRQALRWK